MFAQFTAIAKIISIKDGVGNAKNLQVQVDMDQPPFAVKVWQKAIIEELTDEAIRATVLVSGQLQVNVDLPYKFFLSATQLTFLGSQSNLYSRFLDSVVVGDLFEWEATYFESGKCKAANSIIFNDFNDKEKKAYLNVALWSTGEGKNIEFAVNNTIGANPEGKYPNGRTKGLFYGTPKIESCGMQQLAILATSLFSTRTRSK